MARGSSRQVARLHSPVGETVEHFAQRTAADVSLVLVVMSAVNDPNATGKTGAPRAEHNGAYTGCVSTDQAAKSLIH